MKNQKENKKINYEMRNEIENIIKENHIDRTIFHEAGKGDYERILKKIYYSFCDYQKYPAIQIPYMWTRFREGLKQTELIHTDWNDWDDWDDFYISPKDSWLLAHCEDGGCMCKIWKGKTQPC